ncbi:iron-hydroxamate ABC transporter substrate-binding protein [Sporosarcina sp. ANT_H38]|uniref:iron-hydroxamate ABC transporter substrate-binding protein n=1 Tax=Sporosarcina sp. ANT_H38 TaxID=2597358 RepID=UPI0011F2740E|nr:iron-hydroxamate ABC transporter substrate-binding protein [Sporosarcina sp. ANT_H38]KAA0966315.1 iron-hydroxamate ABC transporter substrate-binding protein [Sporosarcina sp. ANT_H38]
MLKNKRITIITVSFLVLILSLVGCSDPSKEVKEKEDKQTEPVIEEASTERSLIDAMGHEVTIPANPERILASYLEDNLVALGIMPIAQWSINDGAGVQSYLQEYLKDVPTIPSDLPFEVVTSLTPDLILMGSSQAVEGSKYDQYNKIAPTFVVEEENNGDWREQLVSMGDIFGKQEEAKKVLDEYEVKSEESKKLIHESVGSESAAAIWLVNDSFYIVGENVSSGAVLYGDLGLSTPSVVKEISSTATGNWSANSLERLAELDADHIFLINSDKGNGAEMLQDPIWENIPAVKNGHIYEYGSETSWLYSGVIANTQMIEGIVESLIKQN